MKGIYRITINNKYYIGKDSNAHLKDRINKHKSLLRRNIHHNEYMQRAFNKYGELKCEYVFLSDNISSKRLAELEIKYIEIYDSFNHGYNLTKGGEGGTFGYKFSEKEIERRREAKQGFNHHNNRISEKQFYELVEMLKNGKTNREIAEHFGLSSGYVSLIRHKRRYKHLWDKIEEYKPIKSQEQLHTRGRVTQEMFYEIVKMIEDGCSNAEIERHFNLSSGTASRTRHKKLYKQWWIIYEDKDSKKGATTIETTS